MAIFCTFNNPNSPRQFLNHFSLLRLLVVFDWWKHINMDVTLPFWVIMRSGRRNVMNHIASRGTIFGRSFVGVRGIFITMSHTATRASSWPYMDFWIFNFFVTSVSGWGYAPIWEMGVYMDYMVPSFPPWVFGVHKTDHSLLLFVLFVSISPICSKIPPHFI
jgi:hypothetical protein